MDFIAPSAAIQKENLHIHKGKGVEGAKADAPRPSRTGRQERKALRDLSKPEKPSLSAAATKSAARSPGGGTAKKAPKAKILTGEPATKSAARSLGGGAAKKAPNAKILTGEPSERCRQWADEGVERMHFYDAQKHEREQIEKRVERKVRKAMYGLRAWTDMTFYGIGVPAKEIPSDEDDLKLEFEPEVLLPRPPSRRTKLQMISADEEIKDLLDLKEIEDLHFEDLYCTKACELRLKEESY